MFGEVPRASPAEFLDSFRGAHYVNTYLDEGARRTCEELLLEKLRVSPGSGRRVRAEVVTHAGIDKLLAAIALYETQFGDLYASREGLRREVLAYAASLGSTEYAERYWRLAGQRCSA